MGSGHYDLAYTRETFTVIVRLAHDDGWVSRLASDGGPMVGAAIHVGVSCRTLARGITHDRPQDGGDAHDQRSRSWA
jgi:hypothetical protein